VWATGAVAVAVAVAVAIEGFQGAADKAVAQSSLRLYPQVKPNSVPGCHFRPRSHAVEGNRFLCSM